MEKEKEFKFRKFMVEFLILYLPIMGIYYLAIVVAGMLIWG